MKSAHKIFICSFFRCWLILFFRRSHPSKSKRANSALTRPQNVVICIFRIWTVVPTWRRRTNLIRLINTTDGRTLCHQWSSRPDSQSRQYRSLFLHELCFAFCKILNSGNRRTTRVKIMITMGHYGSLWAGHVDNMLCDIR